MLDAPIFITPKAAQEVRHMLHHKNVPEGYALRVGIRGGGCGATFFLGFDQPKPEDQPYTIEAIPVIIDKRHLMYLLDVVLDFEERNDARGFIFQRKTVSA